ncbi:hypothetical protein F5878DRAFT_138453 [Lentinula raphanica]|uniref:Uncharacterized protein n=1 Tax=Lentinula raphanica TaxID=153919 RepID=A0AA38PAR6_9AGAR|nr:hypothetical protein F5878DRAFT_138453 [Lentinula raphanica]
MPSTFTGDDQVSRKLQALISLLSLRNGGQLELPTKHSFSRSSHQKYTYTQTDFSDSDIVSPTSDSTMNFIDDNLGLKRRFLDHFAEIVSKEEGGPHVACAVMREYADHVNIWVARNEGLSEKDSSFFDAFSAEMKTLASQDPRSESLWVLLLDYYSKRLKTYRKNCLGFAQQNRSALLAVVKHSNIEQLICQLLEILFEHPDDLKELCRIALLIACTGAHARTLITGIQNGTQLWRSIQCLGRFRSAHRTFCEIARWSSRFGSVCIFMISKPQIARSFGYIPLSQDEALQFLPRRPGTATLSLREYVSRSPSTSTHSMVRERFNRRQKDTARVHAELQIIHHLHQSRIPIQSLFPYMGCSKLNCFMCKTFLEIFCNGFFKTKGCHGKVYHRWGLPAMQGVEQSIVERLKNTVIKMVDILLTHTCQSWDAFDSYPDSSVGTTPTTSSAASIVSFNGTITAGTVEVKKGPRRSIDYKRIRQEMHRMVSPSKLSPSSTNSTVANGQSGVQSDTNKGANDILSGIRAILLGFLGYR